MFNTGDRVRDKDGTIGIIIEIRENGRWIRFKCMPYMHLANLINNPRKAKRVRKLWTMGSFLSKV